MSMKPGRIAELQRAMCEKYVFGGKRSLFAEGRNYLPEAVTAVAMQHEKGAGCGARGGDIHILAQRCEHAANIPGISGGIFCSLELGADLMGIGATVEEIVELLQLVGILTPGKTPREETKRCTLPGGFHLDLLQK